MEFGAQAGAVGIALGPGALRDYAIMFFELNKVIMNVLIVRLLRDGDPVDQMFCQQQGAAHQYGMAGETYRSRAGRFSPSAPGLMRTGMMSGFFATKRGSKCCSPIHLIGWMPENRVTSGSPTASSSTFFSPVGVRSLVPRR